MEYGLRIDQAFWHSMRPHPFEEIDVPPHREILLVQVTDATALQGMNEPACWTFPADLGALLFHQGKPLLCYVLSQGATSCTRNQNAHPGDTQSIRQRSGRDGQGFIVPAVPTAGLTTRVGAGSRISGQVVHRGKKPGTIEDPEIVRC